MTKTVNTNHTSCAAPGSTFNSRISADSDAPDRNDIDALGSALDEHDHSSGKGLPALRIGTAANPATLSGTPANGTVLMASSGTAARWQGLTQAEADLGADVTLTSANTWYDGPSVSLAAGTWFIIGTVTCLDTVAAANFTARLWDGTTDEASSQDSNDSTSRPCSITVSGFVSPSGTTTYKVSVASNLATNGLIKAAATTNGVGNNASHIRAFRLA